MKRLLFAGLAVSFALLACGGDNPGAAPRAARPASTAELRFVEPAPGANVPAGMVTVSLDLRGGRIIPDTTKDLQPDEGHIHLTMNGKLQSMNYELTQQIEVPPGKHVLQAEFVAGDHAPFQPRVIATTTVEAR